MYRDKSPYLHQWEIETAHDLPIAGTFIPISRRQKKNDRCLQSHNRCSLRTGHLHRGLLSIQ